MIASRGRTLKGRVVSDKMTKTVVVQVTRLRKHSLYKKYYAVSSRYQAHDENGQYHVGDMVTIRETRPLSKHKRWVVIGKTETAPKTASVS